MGMTPRLLLAPLLLTAPLAAPLAAQQGGFHNLKFEEDWSALADSGAGVAHEFPELKLFDLGDGWTLTTGGQERVRLQAEDGRGLTGASPRVNDFILNRLRAHADLRHASGVRVFLEILDARVTGGERRPLPIDRNFGALHNAFVEYSEGDTTVRAGRMELQYGTQRFVSPLDWANTRQRFEGALVRQDFDGGRVDVFVTKPVVITKNEFDHDDDSRFFSGVYGAFGDKSLGADAYVLAYNETSNTVVGEAGNTGGFDLYTVGVRPHGRVGAFGWEAEVARQTGGFAGDPVRAMSWSARGTWTAADAPGKPTVGLSIDVASGDHDPTDNTHETFNQLFPLAHAYLGHLDLIGRANIINVQPDVTVKLQANTTLRLAYHMFRLEDRRDALYAASGAPSLADPTGRSGTDVGEEIDLSVMHVLESLAPHARILVGVARFFPGAFVDALGSSENVDLAYAQFQLDF